MEHCFRLTKGMDLKEEIESYVIERQISGVILCCVGCLNKLVIRLADGKSVLEKDGYFEIVSITYKYIISLFEINIIVIDFIITWMI